MTAQTARVLPLSDAVHTADAERPVEANGSSAKLPSLTGLRWTAALAVFLYHVSVVQYFGGRPASLVNWSFGAGNTGVSFFFVLSGFVLTWSAPSRVRPVQFWRRRFARVYPLHLVTALLALVLLFAFAPNDEPGLRQLAANLTLVQSWVPRTGFYQSVNTVSWSLACEAFFYLLFPLLIGPMRRLGWRGNSLVVVACIAVDVLLPQFAHHRRLPGGSDFVLYYFPPARLPEFLLGIALAYLVKAGRWRGPGVAVSLAITIIGYFRTYVVHAESRYEACTVIGIACLIAAIALADIRNEPSPWRGRLAVKLGELSFAFYMIHLLVIRTGEFVFRYHPKEGWFYGSLAVLSSFTVSLAAAWVLHRYVEEPTHRFILRPSIARPRSAGDEQPPT